MMMNDEMMVQALKKLKLSSVIEDLF